MPEVKVINFQKEYLLPVDSLESIHTEVQQVVENIMSRFMNEKNYDTKMYALSALDDYRYVPPKLIVPEGRYVRYLDLKDHNNIKLRAGGFVTSDNGYSLVIKVPNGAVKISRKNKILFLKLNTDDRIRAAIAE